jgi:lactate dehydrogenase-like 2-hydroxyacid dehydrogenase
VKNTALALGMRVLIHSRSAPPPAPQSASTSALLHDIGVKVTLTSDIDAVYANSDFLSLHCPLNQHTAECINAESLAKMKPSCHLINTARGRLINEVALINALDSGVIASCSLDVTATEPLDDERYLFFFVYACLIQAVAEPLQGDFRTIASRLHVDRKVIVQRFRGDFVVILRRFCKDSVAVE